MNVKVLDTEVDLAPWARRVLRKAGCLADPQSAGRRHERHECHESIDLISIDLETLKPLVAKGTTGCVRDISDSGISVSVSEPLTSDLVVGRLTDDRGVYLLRVANCRYEEQGLRYGMQILDRYATLDETLWASYAKSVTA
ncbi:hypothetical protein Pan216_29880 [Planctomycetes bacterium Pan216]|uniref:PilZ domain protein n=1 Tax=Kolteria novifilia TaxID=2527975 RepID=A0A518B597_9BACT|nr:hypothetical protein Pan216_29880 [Planctomycetes bacterium Pan216]